MAQLQGAMAQAVQKNRKSHYRSDLRRRVSFYVPGLCAEAQLH